MTPIEEKILRALQKHGTLEARELSEKTAVPHASLMSAAVTLELNGFANVKRESREFVELTREGSDYAKRGTPERRLRDVLDAPMVLEDAVLLADLSEAEKHVALQWAIRFGWVSVEKTSGRTVVTPLESKESPVEKALKQLVGKRVETTALSFDASVLRDLKTRKLVQTTVEKNVFLSITQKGESALEEAGREALFVNQLTPQMLKNGSWRGKKFREYDVNTAIAPVWFGKKHAYLEFLKKIKEKLVGLGFQEVHGPLVELEFWNMDALFMAQDHPAREIHDVFQVEDPARGEILDSELLERVRAAHERGLAGSKGWRYQWDPEIAARLVLRSQTTAVSARELAKGLKPPLRLFSIGRVFRPDEIDWKHFIEFNQCEGIVADERMTFRDLLGYLKDFAIEIFGAKEDGVKFAPTYFPFTEPSVEMHVNIPGRGWAEAGGAGMFRPEMLSALRVNVPVLAWGLGIDRLAMLALGLEDIRDLFTQDLQLLKNKW